jgi:hypothetical protein
MRTRGACRGVFAVGVRLTTRWHRSTGQAGGLWSRLKARPDHGAGAVDLRIACAALGRVKIAQRQRLLEDKELRVAPRAGQCAGDLVGIFFTALVA